MKTTFIPDGTPEVLISSGPFKFSRNPIYLGMLTILVGAAFLMSSLSAIIIAFVFGIIIKWKNTEISSNVLVVIGFYFSDHPLNHYP